MDLNTPLEQKSKFENQPVQTGAVDNPNKIEAKRKLEILLGDQNLDPERAEAIRAQIKAIDNGELPAVPEVLAQMPVVENQVAEKNLSPEILAGALSGNINLIEASQAGAGFEAMQMLINKAKSDAEKNKN